MNYKQLILVPAFLLCCLALAQAQGRDQIKLKDGSVIRGTVTEHFTGKHVRIRTDEGKYYQFDDSLVSKQRLKNGRRVISVKPSGYFNNTTVGLLAGTGSYNGGNVQPSIQMVNGYQFLGRYSVGIGVGLDGFNGKRVMPLFGEVKAHLRKTGTSPFIAIIGGFGVMKSPPQGSDRYDSWGYYYEPRVDRGGPMAGVRVGVRNYTSAHFGFTTSVGYRFQEINSRYTSLFWDGEKSTFFPLEETTLAHRIDVRFGIYFN